MPFILDGAFPANQQSPRVTGVSCELRL